MKQLSLALQNKLDFTAESFVSLPENFTAQSLLQKFFEQRNFDNCKIPSVLLSGSSSCGKTHLLQIFAQKFQAEFLSPQFLQQDLQNNRFYILENIGKETNEEALFHLINSAFIAKAFLIFSTNDKIHFQLKDLQSRLKNFVKVEIEKPQPSSIEMLLVNRFSRKQINISQRIIDFIAHTIPREYQEISQAIELIENFCADNKKSPTLKEVSELLLLRS